MSEQIFDILHRLNYQVQDDELVKVTKELSDQTARIDQLRERTKKLQELYDRTANTEIEKRQRIRKLISETQGDIEKQGKAIEKTILSNEKLNKELTREIGLIGKLEQELGFLKQRRDAAFDIDGIKKYNLQIQETEKKLKSARSAGLNNEQANGMGGGFSLKGIAVGSAIGTAVGGLVSSAISGLKDFATDIVDTTNKYEKLRALLENTLGGKQAGADAFKLLTDFAAETPFQLDELTESYLKLVNRGIKPTKEELTAFGDIAAAQGKSFDQLTEAVLDATTGEFERLKEFGIKASQSGNQVTLAFGNITKTVPKTADAIKVALLAIRNEAPGIAGAMKVIANTTEGALSNLADNFDRLKASLGNRASGFIKDAIGGISDLVSSLNDLVAVPVTEQIEAERIEINSLVLSLTDENLSREQKSQIIGELNRKYPELVKNIDLETASSRTLLGFLEGVNTAYRQRIEITARQNLKDKANQEAVALQEKQLKARTELNNRLLKLGNSEQQITNDNLNELVRFSGDVKAINLYNDYIDATKALSEAQKEGVEAERQYSNTTNQIRSNNQEQIDRYTRYIENLKKAITDIDSQLSDVSIDQLFTNPKFRNLANQRLTDLKELERLQGALLGLQNATSTTTEKPNTPGTSVTETDAQLKARLAKEQAARDKALKDQQEKDRRITDRRLLDIEKDYLADRQNLANLFSGDELKEQLANREKEYVVDVNEVYLDSFKTRFATLKKFNKESLSDSLKLEQDTFFSNKKTGEQLQKLAEDAVVREKARRDKEAAEAKEAREKELKAIEDSNTQKLGMIERQQNQAFTELNRALSDGTLTPEEKKPFTDLLGLDVAATADEIKAALEKEFTRITIEAKIAGLQLKFNSGYLSPEDKEKVLNDIAALQKQASDLLVNGNKTDKKKSFFDQFADLNGDGLISNLEKTIGAFELFRDAGVQAYDAINQARDRDLEHDISVQEKRVDAASKIADRGNAELLQREQERLDQLQAKKEAAGRQELAINQALTLSNAILAVAKAAAEGGGILSPVTIGAALAALVAGYSFVRTLTNDTPGFKEGVVNLKGPGTATSDSINAKLSKGETVLPASATEKYGVEMLEQMRTLRYPVKPVLPTPYSPSVERNVLAARGESRGLTRNDLKGLERRLDNVEKAIVEKPVNDNIIDERGWRNRQTKMIWRDNRNRNL